MDRVYEAAWAQLEARDPFRDREHDGERQKKSASTLWNTRASTGSNSTRSAKKCWAICPSTGPRLPFRASRIGTSRVDKRPEGAGDYLGVVQYPSGSRSNCLGVIGGAAFFMAF